MFPHQHSHRDHRHADSPQPRVDPHHDHEHEHDHQQGDEHRRQHPRSPLAPTVARWWRGAGRWMVLAAIAALVLLRCLFVVPETETAILTRLGKPVRTIAHAGLYLRWPIDLRLRFDKRLQLYQPRPAEFLTQDKKNLVVDSALLWQIVDPQLFLVTCGDVRGAELRLHDVTWAALAAALGRTDLQQLVNVDPSRLRTDALTADVVAAVDEVARRQLGVTVVDVQLERLSFPEQNQQSVFARMRAERERIAREYRAQGEEQAMVLRAQADQQREVILAQAYREATEIKGEGEAEAARIYGQAHRVAPEFYRFLRTLESYDRILDEQTTVVLSSESELLRLLSRGSQ